MVIWEVRSQDRVELPLPCARAELGEVATPRLFIENAMFAGAHKLYSLQRGHHAKHRGYAQALVSFPDAAF